MYAKTLDNFRFVPSTKASTARKQRERFNRSLRRVFGLIIPKNNGELNYKELISIGRKYGFFSSNRNMSTNASTVPVVADVKADEIIETLAEPLYPII
ncbi:12150_t:CDS:2 [Rhizophagus irregularis]|nr:12150_t:CDS:2 [Rhizophagus irregularis]